MWDFLSGWDHLLGRHLQKWLQGLNASQAEKIDSSKMTRSNLGARCGSSSEPLCAAQSQTAASHHAMGKKTTLSFKEPTLLATSGRGKTAESRTRPFSLFAIINKWVFRKLGTLWEHSQAGEVLCIAAARSFEAHTRA